MVAEPIPIQGSVISNPQLHTAHSETAAMAAAAGAPLASVVMGHFDDVGEYDVRRHGTPTRPVQADADEDIGLMATHAGATGQATVGGVVSMNHTNQVAGVLRTEMLEMRATLEAKINSLKVEFEVKMSGRKGTGHYESGAIATLIDKHDIVEQKIEDIQKNMENIKDLKELIENDEKITGMIKKYKEIIIEGTLNTHVINVTKKLKDELDNGLMKVNELIETIKKNTEEDMNARFNDLIDAVAEVKKHVNDRSDMPSITPLPNMAEDKLEDLINKKISDTLRDVTRMNVIFQENVMMSLKNYEKEEKETRGDKGGQGKVNNTSSVKTPNDGEGSSPQNIIPTKPPGITEAVGGGLLARSPRANGQVSGADGGGPPATRTAWDSAAADPLQFTSWLGKGPSTQNFSIHTPA